MTSVGSKFNGDSLWNFRSSVGGGGDVGVGVGGRVRLLAILPRILGRDSPDSGMLRCFGLSIGASWIRLNWKMIDVIYDDWLKLSAMVQSAELSSFDWGRLAVMMNSINSEWLQWNCNDQRGLADLHKSRHHSHGGHWMIHNFIRFVDVSRRCARCIVPSMQGLKRPASSKNLKNHHNRRCQSFRAAQRIPRIAWESSTSGNRRHRHRHYRRRRCERISEESATIAVKGQRHVKRIATQRNKWEMQKNPATSFQESKRIPKERPASTCRTSKTRNENRDGIPKESRQTSPPAHRRLQFTAAKMRPKKNPLHQL